MGGGAIGAVKLLKMANRADGIFAVTDDVAIGAIQVLIENCVKIPEEIAIVGFSNDTTTMIVERKLSSVNQPAIEIGRKAAELILGQVKHHTPPETVILKTKLVIRASSLRKSTP